MRIALFSEVYWPMVSGVGVTLLRLTRALEERGHQVRVYTANYSLAKGQPDRPEVHRSPSVPLFLYPDVQWAFPRLRDILDDAARFRPDVVHVATEFALGLAGLKVARQLHLPLIASAHTDYEQYAARYGVDWAVRAGWRYLRWFYGQGHRVLCPSRIYEEHLHSRGVTNTGVWSRGWTPTVSIPGSGAKPIAGHWASSPAICSSPTSAGLRGRRTSDSCSRPGTCSPLHRGSAKLSLVGRGPLEADIRRREIPGVHVAGLMDGLELSAAYASADIFAFPSATETFGNSLLEAMGSGLPSLVAAAGGVLEFSQHGGNAWLVAPNSVSAIAQGLRRLLEDAALRRRLSEGALRTAHERGWDEVYDQLIADYQDAIDNRRLIQAA